MHFLLVSYYRINTVEPSPCVLLLLRQRLPCPKGVRVSCGHLCEAEAPTEAAAETGPRERWRDFPRNDTTTFVINILLPFVIEEVLFELPLNFCLILLQSKLIFLKKWLLYHLLCVIIY